MGLRGRAAFLQRNMETIRRNLALLDDFFARRSKAGSVLLWEKLAGEI